MNGYLWRGQPELRHLNKLILANRPKPDFPVGLPDTPGTTAERRRILSEAVASACGTPAAYRRHLRDGEEPCQRCRQAESARRTARKSAQRARRRAAIRKASAWNYDKPVPRGDDQ